MVEEPHGQEGHELDGQFPPQVPVELVAHTAATKAKTTRAKNIIFREIIVGGSSVCPQRALSWAGRQQTKKTGAVPILPINRSP